MHAQPFKTRRNYLEKTSRVSYYLVYCYNSWSCHHTILNQIASISESFNLAAVWLGRQVWFSRKWAWLNHKGEWHPNTERERQLHQTHHTSAQQGTCIYNTYSNIIHVYNIHSNIIHMYNIHSNIIYMYNTCTIHAYTCTACTIMTQKNNK